jgi:hypothetical protein
VTVILNYKNESNVVFCPIALAMQIQRGVEKRNKAIA